MTIQSPCCTTSALALTSLRMILLEHPSQHLVDDLSRKCWSIVDEGHCFDMIFTKCSSSLFSILTGNKCVAYSDTRMCLDALRLLCKSDLCIQAMVKKMVANHFYPNDDSEDGVLDQSLKIQFNFIKEDIIANELSSVGVQCNHPRIKANTLSIANMIMLGLIRGRVYCSHTEDNSDAMISFKIKVKRTLKILYATPIFNSLGLIDIAVIQSLSRDLTRSAVLLNAIMSSLITEDELSLASSIFSSSLIK